MARSNHAFFLTRQCFSLFLLLQKLTFRKHPKTNQHLLLIDTTMIFPTLPRDINIRSRIIKIFEKTSDKKWNGTDGDDRLFRSLFGVSLELSIRLWGMCLFPPKFNVEHFMDALHFMKTYPTIDVLETRLPFSRKTII